MAYYTRWTVQINSKQSIQKQQSKHLLKCTQNIFQGGSHVRPQKCPRKFKIIIMIGKQIFQPQWYETKSQLQEENQKKNVGINNMLLNIQWVTEEIKAEIKKKKNLYTNENRSAIYQNLWTTAKILQQKLLVIQVHLIK